jgi:hypothetical protein
MPESESMKRFKQAGLLGCLNNTESKSMEWISVKDKFPEDCENVLIYCSGFPITGAYLIFSKQKSPICWQVNDWDESEGTLLLGDVTHWMPLPNPPKEN